jgi:excinuclease ABC subunit C
MEALRAEMEASSERMEYERAGALRDKLRRLEALREQFLRFRFAVETLSFVYEVPGFEGDDRVYVIRRGRVCAELPSPRSTPERDGLSQLAREIFAPSHVDGGSIPSHEVDELLLLSSWFRRFPVELERARTSTPVGSEMSA